MVVLKFGGTSVGQPSAIERVLKIVEAERRPRVVVVSALSGVTDGLLKMAAAGGSAESLRTLDALLGRHLDAARMLSDGPSRIALDAELHRIAAEVAIVLGASAGALSPGRCDEVVAAGELWSSRLLAALLHDRGTPAEWVDARQVLRTNGTHGAAAPDLDRTREAAARLIAPVLSLGGVAVVGGFVGSNPQGRTTTLGRGGSDYSAAVLGACLDVEEIQIWTDVDGVLSADPRILPHARLVAHLSYGEAHDLAFFGAKVLHPGTITPAVHRNIPVIVRNSHRPAVAGTLVTGRDHTAPARGVVAGLACCAGVTLVEAIACEGSEASDLTSKVFEALQSVCNAEIVLAERCGDRLALAIQDVDAGRAPGVEPLDVALRRTLNGVVEATVRPALAMVVVVGDAVALHPGLFAEAGAALREMPVHLTGRPAGGRSLAFVVSAADAAGTLGLLHDCFFGLERESIPVSRDVVQA